MKIFFKYSLLCLVLSFFTGCNDMLSVKPVNSMIPKSLEDFEAVLLGGYPRSDFFVNTEMLTDNVYVNLNTDALPSRDRELWYTFAPSMLQPGVLSDPYWGQLYKSIYYANTVLSYLEDYDFEERERSLYEQIKGEAYGLRAFAYFYLINLYADVYSPENLDLPGVPLSLDASDVTETSSNNTRASIESVWNQIVLDLEKASGLLLGKRISDRYRFSYSTIQLLRSRVALFMGKHDDAVKYSTEVISSYPLADLSEMEGLITNGVGEALNYKFGFVDTKANSELLFFTAGKANMNPYYFSTGPIKPAVELLNLTKRYGEMTDYRQLVYDSFQEEGTSQALKAGKTVYKMYASQDLLCYYVGFKASEAYLIRAEANARLDKTDLALADINKILKSRMRKNFLVELKSQDFAQREDVIKRVLEERRLELAFDGGLRFMDLRRLGKPKIEHIYKDALVYTLEKNDPRYILQIPPSETENSPEMPKNPR
ncbi:MULTISPECIES: RagB/SusD family nutrient uptake outer membrane protein [Sphingobacterium]|uniref:RagB/SusD family nutrient uptake outer membrane protein n=1 Tax=Sphingobacterium TaxID=28453 RepID=UPI0013D917E2|nr:MULTISPECIES: RagB/SusD family nutrient uptake outer membrane protein [unclassified Sphingobacterium]